MPVPLSAACGKHTEYTNAIRISEKEVKDNGDSSKDNQGFARFHVQGA
jgi:hypothetical protein